MLSFALREPPEVSPFCRQLPEGRTRLAEGKPASSNGDLAEERILPLAQRFTLVVVKGLRLGDAKA